MSYKYDSNGNELPMFVRTFGYGIRSLQFIMVVVIFILVVMSLPYIFFMEMAFNQDIRIGQIYTWPQSFGSHWIFWTMYVIVLGVVAINIMSEE